MPEQVAELRRFHRDTNRRGRGPKVSAFPEIESPELFGCGAGTFHVFIDPSGNVCPCDFVPLLFGNVVHERLDAVVRRMGEAMRQPRRHCFLQTNAATIQRHAAGHGYPLSPEVSLQVAAESPKKDCPTILNSLRSLLDSLRTGKAMFFQRRPIAFRTIQSRTPSGSIFKDLKDARTSQPR